MPCLYHALTLVNPLPGIYLYTRAITSLLYLLHRLLDLARYARFLAFACISSPCTLVPA